MDGSLQRAGIHGEGGKDNSPKMCLNVFGSGCFLEGV